MKAGEQILYGDLAEQLPKRNWPQRIGKGLVIGIVTIFVMRTAIDVLIQNFLHR